MKDTLAQEPIIITIPMEQIDSTLVGNITFDLFAGQLFGLNLTNNDLPGGQLNTFWFTPALNATDINLGITVSNNIPPEVGPAPFDVLVYFELIPSAGFLSQSSSFIGPTQPVFEIDKVNGVCPEIFLSLFDETLTPPSWINLVSLGVVAETNDSCIQSSTVPPPNNHISKFSVGGVQPTGGSGGCSTFTSTSDQRAASSCTIIDMEAPQIVRAFVTPSDYVCVETRDNVQTAKLRYNGHEIPEWSGGNGVFCTNEELPAVIQVVAEDAAGNESEMVAINTQEIVTKRTEQSFTAIVSQELNPHHGVEGITLHSSDALKQLRFARSPDFSSERVLHLSERALKELNGEQTVVITYKGPYVEREGQIYVFATNKGLLATFDVKVDGNDIRLVPHEEKPRHGTYDLKLNQPTAMDSLELNALQKAELQTVLAGRTDDLTVIQQNILSMVMRHLDDL